MGRKRIDVTGYKNNPMWVVDEFTEWIKNAIVETEHLYKSAIGDEEKRLKEKYNTFKIVAQKFEELKNE